MALSLKYLPLDEIMGDGRNPKKHDVGAIRASIGRFGFAEAIVRDDRTGKLVAGHGRVEALVAARDAGAEPPSGVRVHGKAWLVPVQAGWASADDAEAAAFMVAANRLTERGGWDDSALAGLLTSLEADGGLVGLGFDEHELARLLESVAGPKSGLTDPDDVPEPSPVPVSKPGDLWLLGPHRVLCGDSTERGDYERVLRGEPLSGAVIADPPYGVAIGAKNRALASIVTPPRVLSDLEGDQGIEEVEKLWRETFAVFFLVMPAGTPYYVFGPQGGDLGLLLLLLRDSGLSPRHILIWRKNRPSFSIGRLDYDYQHEPIVYGWKPGAAHPWHADGTRTSILEFDRPQASPLHPTAKPVDLLAHLIRNSTAPGQTVLDPFGGSGSTLIACEQTGRVAYLMEIDAHYVDVICKRYQEHTGIVPRREDGTEVDFEEGE
jgi:DNA modification methylase